MPASPLARARVREDRNEGLLETHLGEQPSQQIRMRNATLNASVAALTPKMREIQQVAHKPVTRRKQREARYGRGRRDEDSLVRRAHPA